MPSFRLSFSPSLYFDWLLLLKAYKIAAEKVQRSYVSWHWRVMQNLKKNRFAVWKMTGIWWIMIWALRYLKNLHFDWSLSRKIHNFWLKKEQRSYLSWHLWHEELSKFSPEHLKVSKLVLSWDPFVHYRKCMS